MSSTGIKSYKQHKIDTEYDVLIIGSGISGLTAGVILAKEGKKVLILERHYTAGGFTHVFKRKGYEWDVGIHYIGGVTHPQSILRQTFDYITDGKLDWADMGEVYDRVFFGDEEFPFHKGKDNFINHLSEQFPDSADQNAIRQYIDLVQQANKASRTFFAEKAMPPAMAKIAGGQMRKGFLRFAEQTTRDVLEELTDNQKLIGVLTAQFGDYGLPPGESSFAIHAMVANHYLYGGAFPVGGSAQIAELAADVLAAHGGLILTRAEVDEVIIERKTAKGVRMADGQELHAPLIISCAGVVNTWGKLLPATVRDKHKLPEQRAQVKPSVAHLGMYLGFKESVEELGLQKANYWVYPDGKYNHDENIAAFVEDVESDFPLVYISFPASKDPDWENRYPGRATVDIITLAPWEWFAKWEDTQWKRRGDDYDAFKERLAQRLLKVLYRYEPQLEGKVDHYELSTPLSTRDFVNYQQGEIYGLSHDPERFKKTFLRPHTPFKNLYLSGQDIVTAGIGGAMMAGIITVSAINKQDYTAKIRKAAAA